MSNLSDLLPAGAGAKSATFTADGTLATGTTVILQSDGTVKAVGETSTSASIGSATTFASTTTDMSSVNPIAYDSTNNRVVIAYKDTGNSSYGTAVVGTVSGNTISFGSPVVFNSANTLFSAPVFDENAGKVVIFYRDQGNAERGTAIVGTVSGTSISFGSAVVFNSGGASNFNSPVYDPDTQKVVNFYKDEPNSSYGTAVVGTVSGTSISFGSEVVFETADSEFISATYDTTANKMVVAYRDNGNSLYGTAIVGTVSGTSISFGTATVFATSDSRNISVTYDASADKSVICFRDFGDSNKGKAVVGTVSGTSISFGSLITFDSGNLFDELLSVEYFAAGSKIVVAYRITSGDGKYQAGTVSGTSITFDSAVTLGITSMGTGGITYDSTEEKIVVAAQQSSSAGQCQVFNPAYSVTNSANFVGITDEAIANTATGSVVVEGGVITNSTLIAAYLSASGQTTFESGQVSNIDSVYDPDSQKIIIAYKDDGNLEKGTAVVGTISGTSVTYGTPVIFTTGRPFETSIVYDTSNDKVVIVYRNQANSSYPEAIVGTVSGTSISFGTAVTIKSSSSFANHAVFDSTNNKVVVGMYDNSGNNYGAGIVGTVSGTSISFGSFTNFTSTVATDIGGDFDSSNGKVVFAYKDLGNSSHGTAVVGTVSGTSISFGTPVVFNAAESERMDYGVVFDSNANKIVIGYKDTGNSNYGTAVVGTVSGTSISFGSETVFTEGTIVAEVSGAFNSSTNQVVYLYQSTADSNYTSVIPGNVSGTSISFGSALQLNSASSTQGALSYDANTQKMLAAYRDTNGQSNVVSASQDLTVGSTYYVQNDGSLSTTSSSVTAGKALSSTTLLLKG
jgi:hypothetical protein